MLFIPGIGTSERDRLSGVADQERSDASKVMGKA